MWNASYIIGIDFQPPPSTRSTYFNDEAEEAFFVKPKRFLDFAETLHTYTRFSALGGSFFF